MDNLLTLAIIQLIMAILMAVSVLYITYSFLHKSVALKNEIPADNTAFAIFASGILLAVAYLLQGVIGPIIAVTRMLNGRLTGFDLYIETFQYAILFVFIGIGLAAFIVLAAVKLFTLATVNLNEFEELKKNNVAVGITTAVIIIGIAMLSRESMEMLIDSLAPFPELPTTN